MTLKKNALFISLLVFLVGSASAKNAQKKQSKEFGNYIVHYNTLPSSFLDSNIAKQHNFKRSKNRILLNIVIKKKNAASTADPVPATVTAIATNLTGQLKQTKMRKIHSAKGVYYIGEFNISNKEYLNFKVTVKPEAQSSIYTLGFRKQFFTE